MRFNKRNKTIFDMKVKDKLTNKQIAERMGISVARVSQILRDEYKRNKHMTPTDKARQELQEIIAMYNGKVHPREIAVMYSVSDRFVRMLLEGAGIYKTRKKQFPKSIEHTALDALTPKSEYFMGFIAGQGVIDPQTSTISIKHSDKETLMKLSNVVSPKGKAKRRVHELEDMFELRITSKSLCNRLVSNGLLDSRRVYGVTPTGGLLRSANFWRGYIDGSGKIGFDRLGRPFVAAEAQNRHIKEGLILFLGNIVDLSLDIRTNTWKLYITERTQLLRIVELLYLEAPKEIRLARNYERALLIHESIT